MKPIDISEYLTIQQAMDELGCPRRTLSRAVQRAEAAGKKIVVEILGKPAIHKSKIAVLKEYYYPYGSAAHQKMVKKWGASGGTQKRVNREKAERGRL
jgi:hypothetical protein